MSSLYDDLEVIGNSAGALKTNNRLENLNKSTNQSKSGMDTGYKLMQSHMAARRLSNKVHQQAKDQNRSGYAPPSKTDAPSRSEGNFIFNHNTGRMERFSGKAFKASSVKTDQKTLPLGIPNEYNPLIPNEYEEVVKLNIERKRLNGMYNKNCSDGSDLSTDEEDEDDEEATTKVPGYRRKNKREEKDKSSMKCAAIAPPQSLINQDSQPAVIQQPATIPQVSSVFSLNKEEKVDESSAKFGYNPVAAKMMAKMGYKEGQGLGRVGQGMSTALTVEKTGRRAGKIIHEKDRIPGQVEMLTNSALVEDFENGDQSAEMMPPPEVPGQIREPVIIPNSRSSVILLSNMCGPGEVDDDLEPETAEECAKYGRVKSCMIYELPDAPDTEAVRIFVEFYEEESATKAIVDLNGRFFGGRVVRAGFYDSEKFHNLELVDQPLS